MRVLAVDGGQSAIRVRHSAGDAEVAVEGVSRQEGDTVGMVADAVVEGWRRLGAPPVDRAVLGLTTAPTDAVAADRLCRAVAGATGAAEVWLADDAVTTHAGALASGWGVSITAGTGVACLALAHVGAPRIIGGHGFLLGDEGGAFWIGREGLRAVLRAADGRGPATALSDAAATRFDGLADLGERLHSVERPVNAIAHFAPDVMEAARGGRRGGGGDRGGGGPGAGTARGGRGRGGRRIGTAADRRRPAAGGPAWRPGRRRVGGPAGRARRSGAAGPGGRLLAPAPRVAPGSTLRSDVPEAAPWMRGGAPGRGDGAGPVTDPGRYATLVSTWKGAA